MEPAIIQAKIKMTGLSQKDLAGQLGVSPVMVSRVVNGIAVSDRVMRGIADAISTPVQFVFPDYYQSPPKRRTSKSLGLTCG